MKIFKATGLVAALSLLSLVGCGGSEAKAAPSKEKSEHDHAAHAIKYLEDKDAYAKATAEGTVLVDFYADWCGPCKMLAPHLEKLSHEDPNVKIVKVNVDKAKALAEEHQVQGIPMMLLYKNGKLQDKAVGYKDFGELVKFVSGSNAAAEAKPACCPGH
jgi:thioredoxin 1